MKWMFTFIVPVYNVELYIERCINSLINQTYFDFEIILIDDGSTDNSPQICDNYMSEDQRIKVIHKKNGGLSDARNIGIKEAKGEYLIFVDSDDYIKNDTCERICKLIDYNGKVDVIVGEADEIHPNKVSYQKHTNLKENFIYTNKEYIKLSCQKKQFYMPAWINIYKRSFITKNELYFEKGLIHEDMEWSPRVFLAAQKIIYLKNPFYFYIIRDGSITRSTNMIKNKEHLLFILDKLYHLFSEINDIELKEVLNGFLIQQYLSIMGKYSIDKKEDNINLKLTFTSKYKLENIDLFKSMILKINRKMYFKLWKLKTKGS